MIEFIKKIFSNEKVYKITPKLYNGIDVNKYYMIGTANALVVNKDNSNEVLLKYCISFFVNKTDNTDRDYKVNVIGEKRVSFSFDNHSLKTNCEIWKNSISFKNHHVCEILDYMTQDGLLLLTEIGYSVDIDFYDNHKIKNIKYNKIEKETFDEKLTKIENVN